MMRVITASSRCVVRKTSPRPGSFSQWLSVASVSAGNNQDSSISRTPATTSLNRGERRRFASCCRSRTTTTTTTPSFPCDPKWSPQKDNQQAQQHRLSLRGISTGGAHSRDYVVDVATSSSLSRSKACGGRRYYSKTPHLYKDEDDGDKHEEKESDESSSSSLYETINISDMTEEEIEAIVLEEEAKMEAELREKFVPNWKPGMRKRPLRMTYNLEEMEYELAVEEANENEDAVRPPPKWTLRDKRCGALAIKVGMMPLYDKVWGIRYPCTVLFLDHNVVLGHKTVERHGYSAVRVAAGHRKRKNVGKCVLGQYKSILPGEGDEGYEQEEEHHPPYLVREFRITDEDNLLPVGSRIHAWHFVPGQKVDCSGTSKGKGFQGAMKRHNFKGMPASHGVSKSHRALGSTGQCQDPGKVFKGKKMAGRMGGNRVTTQNLRVIKIDRGRNLLYIQGAVPGNAGGFVEVRDAVKRPGWNTDAVPDAIDRPPLPTSVYDTAVDGSGEPGHEVWMPMPVRDPLSPDQDEEAA